MNIKDKMADFGMWLLSEPKAFQITMLMAAVGATFIFTFLAITSLIMGWSMVLSIIWSIFALLAWYKSIKFFIAKRKMGKEQFGNYTLADFMNVEMEEEENERTGSELCTESERVCAEQSNANDGESAGEKHKSFAGRIPQSEEEPEFPDLSFGDIISSDKENSR
jgi:hypothetical protein